MEIALTIDKEGIMSEVAQRSAYTGAKMEGDENADERIATTKADRVLLERLWAECRNKVIERLKKFLGRDIDTGVEYKLILELSESYDIAMREMMERDLYSFYVAGILARWYSLTNKAEAAAMEHEASGLLDGLHCKACYKRRPQRPRYQTRRADN